METTYKGIKLNLQEGEKVVRLEECPNYYLTNKGRVFNHFGRERKLCQSKTYKQVQVHDTINGYQTLLIARLIAKYFCGIDINKSSITYVDGNPENLDPSNLKVCKKTRMQYKGGQACRKLNWELVDKMREGFRNGLKIKDMSYNYNVSKSTVWKIVNNFAWIK